MIRTSPPDWNETLRKWVRYSAATTLLALMVGCAAPPQKPTGPTVEEIAKQQRAERASANVKDGLRKYDNGNYDESMNNFLAALDSGELVITEQLIARKHMAFVHCLSGREANCKEEFEKAITLDPNFDLTPAEAGHPIWGPIFRLTRTELELRRTGRTLPAAAKPLTPGEKFVQEGMKSYEDAEYNKAIKSFQDSLKEVLSDADKIVAHKFMAFSYCLTNRTTLCRSEFDIIFKLDSGFDLSAAEAGHPSWGPSFRTVKAKQKSTAPKK